MQLNCLSFYCSKHFIKLTQQQFPVGPGRHKINVRFESSVLWRYFDVFYFELFCVSVYNHACMHTCMLAHMHTHKLQGAQNGKSKCQHLALHLNL